MNTTTAAALATIPAAIGAAFAGGIYAGIMRGVDGAPDQHLVLLPGAAEDVSWEAAGEWAKAEGGELPTRREQRLLFINLKDQFEEALTSNGVTNWRRCAQSRGAWREALRQAEIR